MRLTFFCLALGFSRGRFEEITLVKHIPQEVEYWPSLLVGGREIDVDLIEGSKYLDRSLLKKVKASKQQQKQQDGGAAAAAAAPEGEMK